MSSTAMAMRKEAKMTVMVEPVVIAWQIVEQVEVEEKGRITIEGVGRRRDRMIGVHTNGSEGVLGCALWTIGRLHH